MDPCAPLWRYLPLSYYLLLFFLHSVNVISYVRLTSSPLRIIYFIGMCNGVISVVAGVDIFGCGIWSEAVRFVLINMSVASLTLALLVLMFSIASMVAEISGRPTPLWARVCMGVWATLIILSPLVTGAVYISQISAIKIRPIHNFIEGVIFLGLAVGFGVISTILRVKIRPEVEWTPSEIPEEPTPLDRALRRLLILQSVTIPVLITSSVLNFYTSLEGNHLTSSAGEVVRALGSGFMVWYTFPCNMCQRHALAQPLNEELSRASSLRASS